MKHETQSVPREGAPVDSDHDRVAAVVRAALAWREADEGPLPADYLEHGNRPLLDALADAVDVLRERCDLSAIAAAWVLDRADQYANDSCCKVAVENLVEPLAKGEHIEAYRHGELGDLLPRVSRIRNGVAER